jgi:hypothetical protein
MSKNKGLTNDGWSDNFIRKLKKNKKLLRDLWNPLAMEKLKDIFGLIPLNKVWPDIPTED